MSSIVSARPPGGRQRDPDLTPAKEPGALGLTSAASRMPTIKALMIATLGPRS